MEFSRTNRKAIGLLILVFALGIGFGILGYGLADRDFFGVFDRDGGGGGGGGRQVQRLTRELNLTPEQQTQLRTILNETREQYRALRREMQPRFDEIRNEMRPRFDAVRDQSRERIRQILTPEQRTQFEEILRREEEN